MKGIEKKVKDQDLYIKNQSKRIREALSKTLKIEGLQKQISLKLLKFMKKEHFKKFPQGMNDPDDDSFQKLDTTYSLF